MKVARLIFLAGVGGLSGCEKLAALQETVEGFTERFVVEGIYLGVESPEGIDLSETEFNGARLTAFLADASQINEIEDAPIENTALLLMSPGNGGSMPMLDIGGGKYELSTEDGLQYVSGEEITLSSGYNGQDRLISVEVPAAPALSINSDHAAGTPLSVDLTGQGYNTALAVVIEAESGEVTWSNQPADIAGLYEMTHPNGILIGGEEDFSEDNEIIVEIPAEAFADEGYYIIGVAGMVVSNSSSFENVNTAVSTVIAGKLRFTDVCTDDYAMLCLQ
jgi:hypothetical protein